MAGPPQRPLLQGGGPADGQDELDEATHPVTAVGEVAVVAGGDEEHADRRRGRHRAPSPPR